MVCFKSRSIWVLGIALSFLAGATNAYAWPPKFGAEFTFTNTEILLAQLNLAGLKKRDEWKKAWEKKDLKKMIGLIDWNTTSNDASEKYFEKMKNAILERCGGCKAVKKVDHYGVVAWRFQYPDKWWFQIAMDPAVIEVITAPATREKFESMKTRMQQDIFESAKAVGMVPEPLKGIGQGHIHIGLESAFDNDPVLFRNYLVDTMNHPELAYVFGRDSRNAALLSDLGPEAEKEFAKIIEEFDRGKIRAIRSLATHVQRRVYKKTAGTDWSPPWKYQSTNVSRTVSSDVADAARTVENRSHRPQKSAAEFIDQITVYEARLNYLRGLKGERLAVKIPKKSEMTAKGVVRRFRDFVVQSGLNWTKQGAPLLRSASYVKETIFLKETTVGAFVQGVGNLIQSFARKCAFLMRPFSLEEAKLKEKPQKGEIDGPLDYEE